MDKDDIVGNIADTLEKIKKSRLNSFICVNDAAIKQAEKIKLRAENGENLPLKGLAVGIKDNIDVEGLATTCGSAVLKDKATKNAYVVDRIVDAGGIIVGKTNMDEFAMGSANTTSAFGPVLNPIDNSRVPGGSSGGSAAAVGAGLVPLALGSDTGGSVRQPAAYCGVIGFKPSVGSVNRDGLRVTVPELDSIGIISADVSLCKTLYRIISQSEVPSFGGGFRVGALTTKLCRNDQIVDSEFDYALKLIEEDHAVSKTDIPEFKNAAEVYDAMSCKCNAVALKEIYLKFEDKLSAETRRRVSSGLKENGEERLERALKERENIIAATDKVFEQIDILITPASPLAPFGLNETPRLNPDTYTQPASLADLPAMTLPTHRIGTGIQIVAAKGREDVLFAFAAYLEKKFRDRGNKLH